MDDTKKEALDSVKTFQTSQENRAHVLGILNILKETTNIISLFNRSTVKRTAGNINFITP